jgi:clan AA aspartic protease
VNVTFRLPGQPDLQIECVVDTGFAGALALAPDAVQALGLPYVADLAANLADDSNIRVRAHRVTIVWDGVEREVAVLALGRRPLLGTALLDQYHVEADFTDGGMVLLDKL